MGRLGLIAALTGAVALVAACGSEKRGLEPLPRAICSELIKPAGSRPDVLVVADYPARGRIGPTARTMAAAVRLTLARHRYRAGPHALAFQACDDSTARAGQVDIERCAGNGKAYARNPSVRAVVGPIHSLCAEALLPETNRGGLAVISPAATHVWLTRPAAGHPDVFDRLYPTGRRTFFRVVAPDDEQGRVAARLAKRLGVRRLFLLRDPSQYAVTIRFATRRAARAAGLRVDGPAVWDLRGRRARELAREVDASGADGAHLSGTWQDGGAAVAAALRARMGPRFPIIASDGFALRLPPQAARAADGMWVTTPGVAPSALPPAGREVARRLGAGQFIGPPLAAQATELLVQAIAASDGTRPDIVRRLQRARLTDGPVGPMRFDEFGDPVPRTITLHRVRHSALLPAG